MAAEEVTEATLPFGMGDVDLLSVSGVFTVVSLVVGFALFHMTDSIGQRLAGAANSFIAEFTGSNPATGESAEAPGV